MRCEDIFPWQGTLRKDRGVYRFERFVLREDALSKRMRISIVGVGECPEEYQPTWETDPVNALVNAQNLLFRQLDALSGQIGERTVSFPEAIEGVAQAWYDRVSDTMKIAYRSDRVEVGLLAQPNYAPITKSLCALLERAFPDLLGIWAGFPISLIVLRERALSLSARERLNVLAAKQQIEDWIMGPQS